MPTVADWKLFKNLESQIIKMDESERIIFMHDQVQNQKLGSEIFSLLLDAHMVMVVRDIPVEIKE